MADYDDLIEALNRHSDLLEEERRTRAEERAHRIENATARLHQAAERRDNAQRTYRLARVGNFVGKALIPLGVITLAGSIIGGFAAATANFLSGVGVVTAGTGAVLNFFTCSKARVKELRTRMQNAEREYQEIDDYVNNI